MTPRDPTLAGRRPDATLRRPYQWLAAGTAGIAGGYVVSSLVAGQLVTCSPGEAAGPSRDC